MAERWLTQGEEQMVVARYGSSISVDNIKIKTDKVLLGFQETPVTPTGETISWPKDLPLFPYSDDFSRAGPEMKATFMHEVNHIWQAQHGVDVSGERALLEFQAQRGVNVYSLAGATGNTKWGDLNVEQQGDVVLNIYRMQNGLAATNPNLSLQDYQRIFNSSTWHGQAPTEPITVDSGPKCFVRGTPILLADGSSKPIEKISVGDLVLAFDKDASLKPRRVVRLFENTTRQLLEISVVPKNAIEAQKAGFELLTVTPGHSFLTVEGDFKEIGEIIRRSELQGSAARIVLSTGAVVSIQAKYICWASETQDRYERSMIFEYAASGSAALKPKGIELWKTYNFEVEELNTYIAGGVRVHNQSARMAGFSADDFEHEFQHAYSGSSADTDLLLKAAVSGEIQFSAGYFDLAGTDRFTGPFFTTSGDKIVISADSTTWFASMVRNGEVGRIIQNNNDGSRVDSKYDPGGLLRSQEDVFTNGTSAIKYFDPRNTHPTSEVEVDEDASGKIVAAKPKLDGQPAGSNVDFSAVGQVLGSALGRALAPNNQFVQIAASTVIGAVGQKLAQAFSASLAANGANFNAALATAFSDFNISIASAGASSVASFLVAELGTALHLEGFSGQLFNAAAGGFAGSVASQIATKMAGTAGVAGVSFEAAIGTINFANAATNAAYGVSALFGTFLAHEFAPAQTHEGAVGGQLLGAVGSAIGITAALSGALGTVLGFIAPGIGSLIGTILGTLIGDAFGNVPHPAAVDLLDQAGTLYAASHYQVSASDGGDYSTPDQLAVPALAIINAYLGAVKGAALDHSKQVTLGYQANPVFYINGVPGHPAIGTYLNPNAAVQAAALDVLQNVEVIGGDLLMKRAHQNSTSIHPLAAPPPDPSTNNGDPGATGTGTLASAAQQLAVMSGDLALAQDYENYLNNREAINALMAANPESAFTAGWIATFARVSELKLNQYGANDFLGGLVGYLDSVGKAGLGFDAANVAVKRGPDGDSVEIKVPNGAEVPGSLSAFASHTSQSSDATGTTVRLTFSDFLAAGDFHVFAPWQGSGDTANISWFGADVANNFNASASKNAILIGGASSDFLTGGNGWDFLDGGAGNDTLIGNAGNDILRGGPGTDVLYGGAGNDTYTLSRGDGTDLAIDSGGGSDTLAFGAGIRMNDVDMQFIGNDLYVGLRQPGVPASQVADRIELANWGDPAARIENFQFADGSTFSIYAIFVHGGTNDADTLSWTDAAAWLDGAGGNDVLISGNFNDTLHGGPGNDFLSGGGGFDTALYDGPASAYTTVSYNGTVAVLSHGIEGIDRLQDIETISFADRTLAAAAVAAFDPWEYLASNTDVIQVFGVNLQTGYDHYVNSGFNEGRATASFDPLEYIATNTDLIEAHFTPASALHHYVNSGYFEHRATTSFDAVEYLASNPDLIQAGFTPASALQHYVNNGYFEHRATNAFDPVKYLASNPDLIQAGFTPASAAQQYVSSGYFAHRPTTSFDAVEYLASNPDLIQAGYTPATVAQQYVSSGYFAHRPTNSFDPLEYLASNPELMPGGITLALAALHYVGSGYFEHRATASFDALEYIASNPDLIEAHFTPAAALQHFVSSGYFGHRATTSFNALEYLASNPDLIQVGFTPASALQHYVSSGYFEHRATTSFDAVEYLASNPDMIQAGFTPASALQHFVSSGYFEHRATTSFDPLEYLASNPDLIQAGFTPASALQHFVSSGYFEHRATTAFDPVEYLASNYDLIEAGFTPAMALQHYVSSGYFEHRATTSFDPLEYVASNKDLIHTLGLNTAAAELQYVTAGYYQERAIASFDAAQYLANNPDVAAYNGSNNLVAARQHYITHGFDEGRTDSKPDQVVVHNADGSTTTTINDAANTASWNSFRTDQDAQGHVTHQLGVNEGGSSWQNDYDVAGSQSWITKISVTNSSNQLVSQVTNNDDGTHTLLANDPANAYPWSTFTMTFDSGWNFTSIGNVTNDDGSHTADMTKIWSSFDTLAWHPVPYIVSLAPHGSGVSDGMPVVLDLGGNGIDIVPLGASLASFDMDGQGGRQHTAWAGNNDGLLAIDLGADGKPDGVIEQAKEIVFTEWSPGASSDMAALRAVFDTDHNGLLDHSDARWSDFRVWQDANGDGVSQQGEVRTLDDLGLVSIGLEPTGTPQIFPDGSAIQGLANFTRADGSIGTAADVALAYQSDAAHILASIHDWHIA